LLRDRGGHIAEFLKVCGACECALATGRVQAECVGAREGLGSFA
jgi:hypothetical protein